MKILEQFINETMRQLINLYKRKICKNGYRVKAEPEKLLHNAYTNISKKRSLKKLESIAKKQKANNKQTNRTPIPIMVSGNR